jgi:cAMP-dependent protein kinase regulator
MSAQEYLESKVTPILEPLLLEVCMTCPQDVPGFCLRWLKDKLISPSEKSELESLRSQLAKIQKNELESSSNDSEDYIEEEEEEEVKPNPKLYQRFSVSAEAYGLWNKPKEYTAKVIPKSDGQLRNIIERLGYSFVFSAIDSSQKEIVANAMGLVEAINGQEIIRQGEDGNSLFFVESGKLECFKNINGQRTFLKFYGPNEAFGELALLYNCPRAASITAVESSKLWELDRETFNHIVKNAAIARRNHFEEVLGKIDILSGMDSYDRITLADGLKSAEYKEGEYVIKQGDWGDVFYMIEEGEAVALKTNQDNSQTQVLDYKPGDYFGELALLRGQPRAASVQAKTYLKCLTLDRQSFNRLLGPLQQLLSSKASEYK